MDVGKALKQYVKICMGQTTMPQSFVTWGLDESYADELGRVSNNLIYSALASSNPVSETVHRVCSTVFRASIAGANEKISARMMSERFAKFMTECLGVPKKIADSFIIPLNVDDDDLLLKHAKDDLLTCFDLVFEDMMGRNTFDETKTASSISEIAERHEARRFKRLDDSSELYLNKFRKRLHLEEATSSSASLESIYVEPEYVYYPNSSTEIGVPAPLKEVIEDFICGDVSRHAGMDCQARVFTILGQPGVGKTSFLQFLISEYEKGGFCPDMKSVYCIPLRELASSGFASSGRPLRFIKDALGIGSEGLSDTLLILDGLDELCLVLSAGASINSFYLSLIRDADSYRNCHVLVTSRLNYVSEVFGRTDKAIVVELKEFSWDRAEEMIDKLGVAREKAAPEAIVASLRDRFEDYPFLTVPLLLYTVIALEINVADIDDIGQFYDRLFAEMTNRSYGVSGPQRFSDVVDPRKLARAFASEMRRQGRKYLDSSEANAALSRIEASLPKGKARKAIEESYGLTFFYEKKHPERFAPEFFHLTFVEFLAAEQIYLSLSKAIEMEGSSDPRKGLLYWWKEMDYLFSGADLSDQVLDFFRYKVESNKNDLAKEAILDTMLEWLFTSYLDKGMVYSAGSEGLDSYMEKASRLFVGYWRLAKCLYPDTPILNSRIDQLPKFINFLRNASRSSMVRLSFRNEVLDHCDLRDLNLSYCDLSGANLSHSELMYTRFVGSDLTGTDFFYSNLHMADFTKAHMDGARIAYADSKTARFDDINVLPAPCPDEFYEVPLLDPYELDEDIPDSPPANIRARKPLCGEIIIDEKQEASEVFYGLHYRVVYSDFGDDHDEFLSKREEAWTKTWRS